MRYSYEDFSIDITAIHHQIKEQRPKFDLILGFIRGGLIPAICLSHKLGVRVDPIFTHENESGKYFELTEGTKLAIQEKKSILLVDDILDSGKTMDNFLKQHENFSYKTAVLIYNTDQPIVADYYGKKISRATDPAWINFWWETI